MEELRGNGPVESGSYVAPDEIAPRGTILGALDAFGG